MSKRCVECGCGNKHAVTCSKAVPMLPRKLVHQYKRAEAHSLAALREAIAIEKSAREQAALIITRAHIRASKAQKRQESLLCKLLDLRDELKRKKA